jgi:hypothetical protein
MKGYLGNVEAHFRYAEFHPEFLEAAYPGAKGVKNIQT